MKILVLSSYAPSLINFRGPMLVAMVKAGHEVLACGPGHDAQIVQQLRDMGVSFQSIPLERTGINPIPDLYSIIFLNRLMRKYCPDVVLSYTIKPVIYGSLAARWAGIKNCYSMITGLGSAFHESSLKGKLISSLYRFGIKKNKIVFFQNPDDKDTFLRLKLIANDTQTVLINGSGVDLEHYFAAPVVKDRIVFLLISRLISEKGIEQYVEAARELKKHHNIRCCLVGKFDTNPSAISEDKVKEWHNLGIIEYLGPAEDIRPIIAQTSVYVLPSYYREGTPRTVLEAMSMGRPVITTDAPGCRETVRLASQLVHEKLKIGANGILVPTKDVEALARAMKFFMDDPTQIERMGKESRRYAEERYDVHKVNAVLLEKMGLS